ncbi:MAG: efflux RND transporter periplasmic adaptor subunit [Cytophagales bacterium]|nr:efflux RND transporter periplasmic adaptor subunit [Cytophagales bacterium]
MKRLYQITLFASLLGLGYACGDASGNNKMAQLEELKNQKIELDAKIDALEAELLASGELQKNGGNKVLISTFEVKPSEFEHQVEIRGSVASKKNVMLTAEMKGKVEQINVVEGQNVTKGQTLIRLDDEVIKNSIAEVETQLELAVEVFDRQARLWEKKIGTEIQYLQTKTNKESLENKLKTLNSQLDMAYIKAPFNGVADDIPVRVGEVVHPGIPAIRLLDPKDVYISADVSESFLGRFSKNQKVEVYFPSQDKSVLSVIKSVGRVLKTANRSFEVEIDLPRLDFPVSANQVVVLNLVDYKNDQAMVVPTKIVQKDSRGNFIFEIVVDGDRQVARKVHVVTGVTYDQKTEIKEGLKTGQLIALEGYRDLTENTAIIISQ